MSEAETGDTDGDLPDFAPGPTRQRMSASVDRFGLRIKRRQRAILVIVAGFTLLAVACVIAGILALRDIQTTDALREERQAQRAGTLVLEALLVAESGQRGYLLLRDPVYLANYDDARVAFTRSLTELREWFPGDAPLVATVGRAGGEKFAELDRTIALGKAGHFEEAATVARSGTGKLLMDEVRHAIDDLTSSVDDEIARTTATQSQLNTLLIGVIVAAITCVAGLAVLLLNDARRHFGLLESREISARQLAETLERRVAQRTRELAEANQRFEAALRASNVTVMTQDRDLVFTWISQGVFGQTARAVIGKSQQDVTPDQALGAITNLKRGVIETGEPARGDIRVAHDGAEAWYDLTVHPLTDEDGTIIGIIAAAVDITRYKEQEARIRLLMRELTHRSKNLLTVIQAIMRQTVINSTSLQDFETRFFARLQSLAGSHDMLVREDWQGASLRELVRSQLGHYTDRADSQIVLTGEPLQIQPDAAQHIGMALHELATNAAKYGALSMPSGKIDISWHVFPGPDGTQLCHLSWEESGGPPVQRPSRRGFGRVVIERTVARALQGEVRIEYAPSGLRWTLEFPERLNPGV